MTRLGTYLLKLFAAEAAALFGVALTIVYLVQTLRIVDINAVRERGLGALIWQTILALPQLSITFLFVCIAIGLARALRALHTSRELHIVHAAQRLPVLMATILTYAGIGALLVLVLSHVIEPAAKRQSDLLRAQAAADLVGRVLVPNRFARLGDGVTVTVGGRGEDGEITSFFADDRRDPQTQRTYIADSALITSDEQGYVLQLRDGTIQYRTVEGQFSEISFLRYDMALERLTGDADSGDRRADLTTWGIIVRGLSEGEWPSESIQKIAERTADGFRVLGLCLFVAAISAFPTGRRREGPMPVEILVLAAVLCERVIMTYAPWGGWLQPMAGVAALTAVSGIALLVRLRVFTPVPLEAHSA